MLSGIYKLSHNPISRQCIIVLIITIILCILKFGNDLINIQMFQYTLYTYPKSPIINETFFHEWENVMKLRKKLLAVGCRKHTLLPIARDIRESLLLYRNAHLAYCPNAKAGTTTWMSFFLRLANQTYTTSNDVHIQAAKMFRPSNDEPLNWNNVLIVTGVRHPFTRLVSAYHNKVKEEYLKDFYDKIMKRDRESTPNFDQWKQILSEIGIDVSKHPTFEEFCHFALNEIETCYSKPTPENCFTKIDVHWIPYFVRCNPCLLRYDIISKTETLDNDLKYIKMKILKRFYEERNVLHHSSPNPSQISSHQSNSSILNNNDNTSDNPAKAVDEPVQSPEKTFSKPGSIEQLIWQEFTSYTHVQIEHATKEGINTNDLTRIFWALLPKTVQDRLVNAYRTDFDLFGYYENEFDMPP